MPKDACFFVEEHQPNETGAQLLRFLLDFMGFNKTPTREALLEAVREELEDQTTTALRLLSSSPGRESEAALHQACVEALQLASAASAYYPYAELQALLASARDHELQFALPALLETCQERYLSFQTRLQWLMHGTTQEQAATLDPKRDCDRFYHYLSSEFRAEDRVLDLISVNRIAQSATVSLFFHSTREAELNPVYRFYDTFLVFSNFIEWGQESQRGRACSQVMNRIHGRYYIPNAGMKYVLLQMAFTWIDGVARIGHRPLTEAEKQGYFHAYLRMGRTMHIDQLSDDYEEMYAWYRDFNQANAEWAPIKTRTFETIVGNSLKGLRSPELKAGALLAARVAMDDTYRRALGYADPSADEQQAVQSVFKTAHYLQQALPNQAWVRSLQETPVRRDGYALDRLGVQERSSWMPKIRPDAPNGGYPERQKPVTSQGELAPTELATFSWEEVCKHTSLESLWVVIDGFVYDVTSWAAQHPGGQQILLSRAGKDASSAFRKAKHSEATQVFKLNYRIGQVRLVSSNQTSGDARGSEA